MDERDRQIIAILQRDGRATLTEIGEEVEISVMGAKKRVKKLQDSEIIKVRALLNAEKLKIVTAVIAMEFESYEAIEKTLERLKECPRIIKFFVTTGSYNLFALIFAEDYHSLESVSLEKCSLRAQEGVKRFEVFPVQEIQYDSFLDIKVVENKKDTAPCGVDCGSCRRYSSNRCLGCPATVFYRGRL